MSNPFSFLTRNLWYFLLAMILANIAGQMLYTMLPIYLTELNASVAQVGLVFTLASLVPLALQIFGGWLSDNIGRLRTIALGSSVSVFAYLMFVLAPSWEWVLAALCVEYVSNSMVGPSFGAYIADQSSDEARGKVFGISSGIYMIVTVIGPALGGWLAYSAGFRPMLAVAGVIYACATLVRVWMALSAGFEAKKQGQALSLAGFKTQFVAMAGLLLAGGLLTWIWVIDAVGDTAFSLVYQFHPIYMEQIGGLNVASIGLVNAAFGIGTILASFAAGWLVDKYSERLVMAAGFLLESIALVVFIFSRDALTFALAMFLLGLGAGSLMPAFESLISKVVPEDKRGIAFGLFGTSLGILSLPFPWLGGQLWEHLAPAAPYWITVAAVLVSVPIAWFKFVVEKKEKSV